MQMKNHQHFICYCNLTPEILAEMFELTGKIIVNDTSFAVEIATETPIFSRYPSILRVNLRCAQYRQRTDKRPTCVPDFEKHPPLFIGTLYTLELPCPL